VVDGAVFRLVGPGITEPVVNGPEVPLAGIESGAE